MSLKIKTLIQEIKTKLDELETKPVSNIPKIDLKLQQDIERYKNLLNRLRFIDRYLIDIELPFKQYKTKQNEDIFRLAYKFYNDYAIAENIILDNDFHDLIPDTGTIINLE